MGPRPRAQAARAAAPDRRALDPTRSGPVRSAATPRPTATATPAARPGPLHPTRHATAARADTSAGLGGRRGHSAWRFPAARPRAAEARGYAGVHPLDAEDPPKMCAMRAAGAALSLIVMARAVPRELEARRRARLRTAQEQWAELMDRRA